MNKFPPTKLAAMTAKLHNERVKVRKLNAEMLQLKIALWEIKAEHHYPCPNDGCGLCNAICKLILRKLI